MPLLQRLFKPSILFLLCVAISCEKKSETEVPDLDPIFKEFNRKDGPGCAVGVVKDGKLVFSKGYGIANLEYDIPITPSTVFDIASVSKQFAGLAISTLVEEGKIKLDDDVRLYIPEMPEFNKTITIRHLVNHTSGLRDWPQTLNVAGWRWDEVISFEDIMRMVKNQKDLDFEPGERYSYSNTGYNVLSAIVEKVSGESFSEWTADRIFEPLDMEHSHFQDDYKLPIKNLAYSYYSKDDGYEKAVGALTAYGSSSLFTTVDDLSKWLIHFDKEVAAKNPVYTNMLTQGILNNGEKTGYGFGLVTNEDRGLKTISHNGGWQGYRTIITNYPSEKLSIIILSNFSEVNVGKFANEVATKFLEDRFEKQKKVATADPNLRNAKTIDLDRALARKYAGTYELGPGWVVTLTFENGDLMVQANGEPKFPVQPKSDSVIWIDAYSASMTFVPDKTGAVNLLKYKGINAKRIYPNNPDPKEYPLFAGTYYSTELGTEYKVTYEDGKLKMHHMRNGDFDLDIDPSGDDQFSSKIGAIHFVRDDQQKITGLTVSGGRVKNLRFEKQ